MRPSSGTSRYLSSHECLSLPSNVGVRFRAWLAPCDRLVELGPCSSPKRALRQRPRSLHLRRSPGARRSPRELARLVQGHRAPFERFAERGSGHRMGTAGVASVRGGHGLRDARNGSVVDARRRRRSSGDASGPRSSRTAHHRPWRHSRCLDPFAVRMTVDPCTVPTRHRR